MKTRISWDRAKRGWEVRTVARHAGREYRADRVLPQSRPFNIDRRSLRSALHALQTYNETDILNRIQQQLELDTWRASWA